MEVDVEVFVILTMIMVMRACVLQGVSATCETHLNLNLAKLAETGTRYKQRLQVLSSDKYIHKHEYKYKAESAFKAHIMIQRIQNLKQNYAVAENAM